MLYWLRELTAKTSFENNKVCGLNPFFKLLKTAEFTNSYDRYDINLAHLLRIILFYASAYVYIDFIQSATFISIGTHCHITKRDILMHEISGSRIFHVLTMIFSNT